MAQAELIKDAGRDFTKILSENPLPASFQLLINKKRATDEGMKAISKQISPLISNVNDIQYPDRLVTDKVVYVKYRRY